MRFSILHAAVLATCLTAAADAGPIVRGLRAVNQARPKLLRKVAGRLVHPLRGCR